MFKESQVDFNSQNQLPDIGKCTAIGNVQWARPKQARKQNKAELWPFQVLNPKYSQKASEMFICSSEVRLASSSQKNIF